MPLSRDDLDLIEGKLNREINEVEEELFANLWSEHCAYRSSKKELSKLPTSGENVFLGPGDDAGVIEFPDGEKLAVGIESHNHPSYVDPYNGAATGVGGIVRDILSMGARPIALLDPLRFGEFEDQKNRYLFDGVVSGISDYGNSIGVPTVGGDVEFEDCYNGNPLVNVFCVGIVEEFTTAESQEPGNKLIILGSATGRDGLGGAAFASSELDDEAEEEERHSVQIGDPFTEKLLIESVLEMANEGLIESCRDLGAAGLGGASSELCSLGDNGAELYLDELHTREKNMSALELLLAESQERMLIELDKDNLGRFKDISNKYDLSFSIIGELIEDKEYRVYYGGDKVIDLPVDFLTDGAPLYERESKEPKRKEKESPDKLPIKKCLERLMREPNIGSKNFVYRQYDHEVQIRTIVRPGEADAAVLREGDGAVALSAGSNAYYGYLDPFSGGMMAVFINAMNLATVGAEPLGMVDCLNFPSPENEENYWRFEESVSGIADLARRIDTPILGGNVSFYNESEDKGTMVNPTPNIGMVGWLPSQNKTPSFDFEGKTKVYLMGKTRRQLGGSQYYEKIHNFRGGDVPRPIEEDIKAVNQIKEIVRGKDIVFCKNINKGGLGVSLARTGIRSDFGLNIDLSSIPSYGDMRNDELLFSENPGRALILSNSELKNSRLNKIGKLMEKKELKIKLDDNVFRWNLNNLREKNNVIGQNM